MKELFTLLNMKSIINLLIYSFVFLFPFKSYSKTIYVDTSYVNVYINQKTCINCFQEIGAEFNNSIKNRFSIHLTFNIDTTAGFDFVKMAESLNKYWIKADTVKYVNFNKDIDSTTIHGTPYLQIISKSDTIQWISWDKTICKRYLAYRKRQCRKQIFRSTFQ